METDQLTSATSVPAIQESVVDFWESVPRDWPRHKYDVALVDDLDMFLREYGQSHGFPIKRVLDCGCGTGNPSIGLAKKGYEMFGVDADPNMVERFKKNCREAGVKIPVVNCDWRDLNGELQRHSLFDAAICRGNGLVYAASWEQTSVTAKVAAKAVAISLRNIASVIRSGGLFYVDVTNAKEYANPARKLEFVGVRETKDHKVMIYWITDYNLQTQTRYAHGRRLFESNGTNQLEEIRVHTFTSYLLSHKELKQAAAAASLELVQEYAPVTSECAYDVFLFRKAGEASKP